MIEATAALVASEAANGAWPAEPELQRIALLRKLRATSPRSAEKLAETVRATCEWKRSHGVVPRAPRADGRWAAPVDLPNGEWASRYMQLGLRCGRARGGHPVKIERAGLHNIHGLTSPSRAEGERRVEAFYHSLLEDLEHTLDAESRQAGRMLSVYEVFDFRGLSMRQMASPFVLSFIKSTLLAVARSYSGSTQKCIIINAPFVFRLLAPLLEVLPKYTKDRIHVVGSDYADVVEADLDDEARRLLEADGATLTTHRASSTAASQLRAHGLGAANTPEGSTPAASSPASRSVDHPEARESSLRW
jgi:hypothetical protein